MRNFMTSLAVGFLAIGSLAPLSQSQAREVSSSTAVSWGTSSESDAWSRIAALAIEQQGVVFTDLVPTDIQSFCPAFSGMSGADRQVFWGALLSGIAAAESDDDVGSVRWHVYDSAAHRPTFRRGLLQIAIESANNPALACAIENASDLEAAEPNIRCAVRILGTLLQRDGAIARSPANANAGGARYWAALRRTATMNAIAASTSSAAPCGAKV